MQTESQGNVREAGTTLDPEAGADASIRSPEELMSAVAEGDQRAFELLYDRLAAPVFGIVRAVVRDPAQSEEVAQEVFVDLWRTAARYRQDKGGAISWAVTIAHRRAVDRVRTAQARAARERNAVAANLPGRPHDEVLEAVLTNSEHQQVRECLRVLTTLQHESILLAYFQALTYREVAEILKVATGTVKHRMRSGLRRLRDCLLTKPAPS